MAVEFPIQIRGIYPVELHLMTIFDLVKLAGDFGLKTPKSNACKDEIINMICQHLLECVGKDEAEALNRSICPNEAALMINNFGNEKKLCHKTAYKALKTYLINKQRQEARSAARDDGRRPTVPAAVRLTRARNNWQHELRKINKDMERKIAKYGGGPDHSSDESDSKDPDSDPKTSEDEYSDAQLPPTSLTKRRRTLSHGQAAEDFGDGVGASHCSLSKRRRTISHAQATGDSVSQDAEPSNTQEPAVPQVVATPPNTQESSSPSTSPNSLPISNPMSTPRTSPALSPRSSPNTSPSSSPRSSPNTTPPSSTREKPDTSSPLRPRVHNISSHPDPPNGNSGSSSSPPGPPRNRIGTADSALSPAHPSRRPGPRNAASGSPLRPPGNSRPPYRPPAPGNPPEVVRRSEISGRPFIGYFLKKGKL